MQRVNLPDDKPIAGATRGSGRTAVFVKDGCEACGQLVQRLQSSGTEFDLYMVGSRQDDARIRDWAKRANVDPARVRSEEHTSELQSLMRISYAVFCLKKKIIKTDN